MLYALLPATTSTSAPTGFKTWNAPCSLLASGRCSQCQVGDTSACDTQHVPWHKNFPRPPAAGIKASRTRYGVHLAPLALSRTPSPMAPRSSFAVTVALAISLLAVVASTSSTTGSGSGVDSDAVNLSCIRQEWSYSAGQYLVRVACFNPFGGSLLTPNASLSS